MKDSQDGCQPHSKKIDYILDSIKDSYLFLNDEMVLTYVNRQAEEFFDKSRDQCLGNNFWDVYPEMTAPFYKTITTALKNKEIVEFEGFYPPLDKWLEIHIHPLEDGACIYFHDISERVKNEQHLIDNEKRLRSIIENVVDAVIAINEEGIIESFNPAAEKIFGYKVSEAIGKNVSILMPEPDRIAHDAYLKDYMRTNIAKIIGIGRELTGKRKDGTTFPMELAIGEVRMGSSRIFTGVARDITERKKTEAILRQSHDQLERRVEERTKELEGAQNQLLQSEKMASIGQLAAGVAHEINNPIGYINSNISTLEQYMDEMFQILSAYDEAESMLDSDSPAVEYIESIKKRFDIAYLKGDTTELIKESQEGLMRVKRIVQDLKDFSHVDETEWQWANLHDGFDSTLNIVNNEIKDKAEVVKNYGDLPLVECIPSQINQVFMNLLINASHAIEDHGTITFSSGVEGKEVWIEVSDNGKGIEKEKVGRVFDPFFTTKPVGDGTGLGLSLSYGIVKKHNGRITVDSEVGRGTTFRINLPIKQEK